MVWKPDEDWSGREMSKVWAFCVPYTRGRVLDIGAGKHRMFNHWTTLDSGADHGGTRVADIQCGADKPLPFLDGSWDSVVSSHCLEHIEDHVAALTEWWRVIRPGGYLVLYLPDKNHYPRIGMPGSNPDHKHDFAPQDIGEAMKAVAAASGAGWVCLEDEVRSGGSEYSFFQVFRKRDDAETIYAPWRKPEKSMLVIRYGAAGDHILASSILPHFKEQGWTITFNSAPPNASVLQNDPHIDAWWLQDKDQVRNDDLGPYWWALRERFDRIVNLCESIECALLTIPNRMNDTYPDEVRRRLHDVNYMERTHDIADLPYDFRIKFYPLESEVERCRRLVLEQYPGRKALWVLSGSSVHKVWPYMPQAIVRLMYAHPDLHVVMAGDESCRELEQVVEDAVVQYFGSANRLVRTCGLWPVRATMTLAQMVDVVIGPETGVLNAVCLDPVPKVVYLSHSTANNLTKHWTNTTTLVPEGEKRPACYPCHRLHPDWLRCNQGKTGTAACQEAISIDTMVDAVAAALPAVEAPAVVVEPMALAPVTEPVVPMPEAAD